MSGRFRPLILCYHAVSDSWPHILSVRPRALDHQLQRLLQRGYRPATAQETLRNDRKLLHVTFDDAYRSVANALPTLERLGIPATVFACPSYADGGRPLDVPELRSEAEEYPGELSTMDWDELRALAERDVEIGSHTLTHAHLPELSDSELYCELAESRDRLEAQLERACRFVAYPYGDDDRRVHAAARAVGYEAAFASPGVERPVNVYALPRVGIWREEPSWRVTFKTSPLGRRLTRTLGARGARGSELDPD